MNELTKIKQRILERIEIYVADIESAEEKELTEDEKTIFKSVKNIINEEFDKALLEAPTNTAKWAVAYVRIDCIGHRFKEYKCSNCGNIDDSCRKNKFCPECGRRMEGRK